MEVLQDVLPWYRISPAAQLPVSQLLCLQNRTRGENGVEREGGREGGVKKGMIVLKAGQISHTNMGIKLVR